MNTFLAGEREVHHDIAGAGPPLVFVHGSAGSARQWKRLFQHFARTRRVLAYDLPGCGLNRPFAVDGDAVERYELADDARALCAALELVGEPADVVAHSAGSLGVLRVALERPHALRTLTLFEPVLFTLLREAGDPAFAPVRAYAAEYRRLFEREGPAAAMASFVDFWNGAGSWSLLPEPARASMLVGAGRLYGEWGLLLDGATEIGAADLARVRHPILYFCGDRTLAPVVRLTEIATQKLPRCRKVSIAGATHMAPFTHAAEVTAAIEHHLGGAVRDA